MRVVYDAHGRLGARVVLDDGHSVRLPRARRLLVVPGPGSEVGTLAVIDTCRVLRSGRSRYTRVTVKRKNLGHLPGSGYTLYRQL